MTSSMYEGSSDGDAMGARSPDMTRGAAEGSTMPSHGYSTDVHPDIGGVEMPPGDMNAAGASSPLTADGEMPTGAMGGGPFADVRSGVAGGVMATGALQGGMPIGDMLAATAAALLAPDGGGRMPTGSMDAGELGAAARLGPSPSGLPMAGMEVTGSWRLIVSGVSVNNPS